MQSTYCFICETTLSWDLIVKFCLFLLKEKVLELVWHLLEW